VPLGAASYICGMFIRKNKNRSGSVSIQIILKTGRQNKVIETIGCARTMQEEESLLYRARTEIERLQGLQSLFIEHDDSVVESFVESLCQDNLQIVGAELVLGRIYDQIGYPQEQGLDLFRNLVLCRLVYPGSKLKTIDYFKKHLNLDISVYSVYRFLDQLHSKYKQSIEDITFAHTRQLLKGIIGVVFYDMTTLYFEASEEDDFRITGFSKDGKHQQPQIVIGLLVGNNGYPIGYEVFEGNTSETKTLIPVLESFQTRFNLDKPIIVADAALLSQKNIDALVAGGYQYILGGRLKNESDMIKKQVLDLQIKEGVPREVKHPNGRLIVTYSEDRARNDLYNRGKGLKRLEKKVKNGRLSKEHINNRGYNKYLKLDGEIAITIDYEKFASDNVWDGLKGYVTNTILTKEQIIGNYGQLWQIEKAFRISKTDLRIRPIYHRIKERIEAHLCICFCAYKVYKELERLLKLNNIALSPEKALREINQLQKLTYMLPKSRHVKIKLLRPTLNQLLLLNMKI
jgi:transposase